jgi:hypothetical protein
MVDQRHESILERVMRLLNHAGIAVFSRRMNLHNDSMQFHGMLSQKQLQVLVMKSWTTVHHSPQIIGDHYAKHDAYNDQSNEVAA